MADDNEKSLLDKAAEFMIPGKLGMKLLKKKAGEFVSNVKPPKGYNLPGESDNSPLGFNVTDQNLQPVYTPFVEKNLKLAQGLSDINEAGIQTIAGIDKPAFDSDPRDKDNIAARTFLLRKSFDMTDEEANNLGGQDTFIKTGDKVYKFNPNNAFGKRNINQIDKLSKDIMEHKMNTATRDGWTPDNPDPDPMATFTDETGYNIPQVEYPYKKVNSVLGHIQPEQLGEGEDEKGYYVRMGGKDKWDFNLHDGESILDNIPVNLGRFLLDKTIDPQQVNFESKVYIPGIKKQPRKKKISGDGTFTDPDTI